MDFKNAIKEILKVKGEIALNDIGIVKLLEDYGAFDDYPVFRSILETVINMEVGNILYNVFFESIMNDKGARWVELKNILLKLPYDEVYIDIFLNDIEYAFINYAYEKGSDERDINTYVEEMLNQIWTDNKGVKYSADKTRLLNASEVVGWYIVKPDTKEICQNAFDSNHSIEKLILPKNLKKIDRQAFSGCVNLEKIVFYDGVTEIGAHAFGGCISLSEVYLPDGLLEISEGLFSVCTDLLFVHIPKSVTSIGANAFCDCHSLQFLVVPDNVTSIGEAAFDYCNSLRYVVLPQGLTTNDSRLFDKCKSLQDIFIPQGSLSHFSQLFREHASKLREYDLEKPVYTGDTWVNEYYITRNGEIITSSSNTLRDICDIMQIKNYTEDSSQSGIIYDNNGNRVRLSPILKYKSAAEVLVLGDKITVQQMSINSGKDWINYAYMTDYETFETIFDTLSRKCYYESKGHNMCSHIRQTDIDNYIVDEKGVVYSKDRKRLIKAPSEITDYIIPDVVEVICDRAFEGSSNLISVSIPDSTVFVGDYAFSHCHLLDNITIPHSVLFIGKSAFRNCKLHNLQIENGLISIGDWAFESCRTRSLVLPDSLRYIGKGAFKLCRLLKELNIPESVVYIGQGAFFHLSSRRWQFPGLPKNFVQPLQYFNIDPQYINNREELSFRYPFIQ